jgi:hypothetical protein
VLRTTTLRALPALALAASLLGVSAFAPSPSRTQAPTAAPTHAIESFEGSYVLARDARELRAMDGAIDRVVDQMNIFIREIARGEIHRRITPEQRIAISVFDANSISVALDQWGPIALTVGGPARRVRGASGEDVDLTVRLRQGRLVQHSVASNGTRTNTFSLSPDTERIRMHVSIASGQLPSDIRYTLTYRRAD